MNVVLDASFSIDKGEILGIVGPNGSGKSTLLKTLSKILPPLSGAVFIENKNLVEISYQQLARRMGVVPQETLTTFPYTVEEVVLMGRYPHQGRFESESREDIEIAAEAMRLTDTYHLRERQVMEVSGGEKQRIIIAQALTQKPGILLLDEPTNHLDINYQQVVMNMVRGLAREKDITVIAVIHDLNLASQYCDRLILVKDGRIFSMGSQSEVLTRENLKEVFNADVIVREDPITGVPFISIIPETGKKYHRDRKVHIIGGGGSGAKFLYLLHSLGFEVSCGVINDRDTDHEVATGLQLPLVIERPYSAISNEAYRENLKMLSDADKVVVSDMPLGHGNLRNLDCLQELTDVSKVLIFSPGNIKDRDYTDGLALEKISGLIERGAKGFTSFQELIDLIGK